MFVLPDLPYVYDALEPTISAKTMHVHHDKHHAGYVKTLNELLAKAGRSPASLEEVIAASASEAKLYNSAAQAWNHAFFWDSMAPGAEKPRGDLAAAITSAFGDSLAETFVAEGAGHFGSGWVWLIADAAGKLTVASTHDAHDMVTVEGRTPLLVCDVWEHAYYLDYQNDRKAFLTAWFNHLANWDFAAAQLAAATGRGPVWRYPAPARDSGAQAA